MATLLSAKINVTDIYNALDCVIEGKVLDARQGKVLSDALTSLQAAVTSLSSSKADKTYTDTELAKKVDKIEGKGLSTDDYISTKKLSDTASSGTIAVATKTVKTLSTTLTNAHTVVISPTVPADLTQEQEATLILKTGATVPAISFATAGVTFVWMNQPEPTAYIINKTYTFLFFWESATVCQVFYAVKS